MSHHRHKDKRRDRKHCNSCRNSIRVNHLGDDVSSKHPPFRYVYAGTGDNYYGYSYNNYY